MEIATLSARIGLDWDTRTGAISMPVYQTATFRHPGLGMSTGYDYTRSGNPTRQALEEGIARLDGGCRGFAYSSGMAAIANLLLLFNPGDHLVVTEDLYGGAYRLFEKVFSNLGLSFSYVDTSDDEGVRRALRPETRGLFVESLTNPLLKVADIAGLARLSQERGLIFMVDNTFLTPYLMRPLEMGADITLYSATKYLAGHNDVLAGLVVAADEGLAERIRFYANSVGAVLGPQDSWLTIRGMKTLAVRMDRQEENAGRIACWLVNHPLVKKVYYPGLKEHPGHDRLAGQSRGFGAMISFEVVAESMIEKALSGVKLISYAESLGGVESLITFPVIQTHADMDPQMRDRLGINNLLLRLSVGIEDASDLIADLEQALGDEGGQGTGQGEKDGGL
ncbi:MAG: PLP-dependent aspartate aminotransferase family protein [Smithellaceae bacterium]|nr:PLP-dependent aspartate aminotransferase family protein [Smithellaceae bacterium]